MSDGPTGNRFFPPLGIRGRLVLWFIAGAVATVALGSAVIYTSGLASIQGTLGQTYCQIASRAVGQFETRFHQRTNAVRSLATDVLSTEVALEALEAYRGRSEEWIHARRHRLASEWDGAVATGREAQHLHPQLTHRVTVLAHLDDAVRRFSVYDAFGVLLATSSPPPRRVAQDAAWFKAAKTKSRHFAYVDLDKDRGELTVSVPIWGGIDIVGYVVSVYDFAATALELTTVHFGGTGEAILVDYAGVPLMGAPRDFLIHAIGTKPAGRARSGPEVNEPYWLSHSGKEGWSLWRRLSCVAPMPIINALRARFDLPPWFLIITQSPDESYVALKRSLDYLAMAGGLLIIMVGIVGAMVAWHIAAPLKQLQAGVRRFAQGERDQRVELDSSDEIGELAQEFNQMAERITASENELRAFAQAVEDAADAIIMTDPKGIIYYVNPAFRTITGYAPEEVRGGTPSILRSGLTPDWVYRDMWGAVNAGRPWRGELRNRRKSGDLYPVDLTISPVHDDRGRVVSLLGIQRDITLARQYSDDLEREVEARTREIAETQGLTAMGRMASMIAHDLRNALSTVKMNLQILFRRHDAEGDVEREHAEMGLDQVRYMEEIVRDMLSFARPEGLKAEWWDIGEILDDAVAAVSPSVGAAHAEVVREDGRGLPKIHVDRVKMLQVLRNLIENAVQAMPGGGTLSLGTGLVLDDPDPMVSVTIRDEGEGISDDIRAEIFEPFFTTRTKGTGLGLAIVKRIIEQHGADGGESGTNP